MENLNSGWSALYLMNYPEQIHKTAAQGTIVNTSAPVTSPTVINAPSNSSGKRILQILVLVGISWVVYEIIKASNRRKREREGWH